MAKNKAELLRELSDAVLEMDEERTVTAAQAVIAQGDDKVRFPVPQRLRPVQRPRNGEADAPACGAVIQEHDGAVAHFQRGIGHGSAMTAGAEDHKALVHAPLSPLSLP